MCSFTGLRELASTSCLAAPTSAGTSTRFSCAGCAQFAFDFGDAPDPTYPTLAASGGAAHVVGGDVLLGSSVDVDSDGQPTSDADGDDSDGNNDDEGVTFTSVLQPGSTATLTVESSAGLLNAWIDFNTDGDWEDQENRSSRTLH